MRGLGRLLRLDKLGGALRALLFALALERGQARRSARPSAPVEIGAAAGPRARTGALPRAATTALGLLFELLEQARARVLVDPGDDVQGEVEDALEVARADVEQDAQADWACP